LMSGRLAGTGDALKLSANSALLGENARKSEGKLYG
jgi:hypothetical protein